MRSPTVIAPVGGCAVLLAACGGIPSSGEPISAGPAGSEDVGPQVVRDLQPATEDMMPKQIVEGFLDAMEIYEPPGGYPTAATYLTNEAHAAWEPLSEIVIYESDAATEIELNGDTGQATLALDVQATYDRVNGIVREPENAEPATYNFPLERVGDQWRLAEAPEGLLIETESFDRYFSPHNIYFFNQGFDGTTLVPDPVYLPTTANEQTLLVKELLAGPSDWLDPSVESAFPERTSLEPEAVTVTGGGDATVTLSSEAVTLPDGSATRPDTRNRMVTQLRATLGDLRQVRRVQVMAGTTLLSGTEEDPYVEVASSSGTTGPPTRLYTVTESGVSWVADGAPPDPTPVPGPLGARTDVQEVAVDRNDRTAAAVTTTNELIFSDLEAEAEITSRGEGAVAFDSLAWDGEGLLWAIERLEPDAGENPGGEQAEEGDTGTGGKGDSDNRLMVIDPETGEYEDVTPTTPGGAEIEQFAIAPDGSRLALVIDGSAFLARVEREPAAVERDPGTALDPSAVRVSGLRELHFDNLSAPLGGVAWYDADELAMLTAPEPPATEQIDQGSGEVEQSEPPAPVVRLARLDELVAEEDRAIPNGTSITAPTADDRLAVGTSENEVWIRFELGRWIPLEDATAPAYSK